MKALSAIALLIMLTASGAYAQTEIRVVYVENSQGSNSSTYNSQSEAALSTMVNHLQDGLSLNGYVYKNGGGATGIDVVYTIQAANNIVQNHGGPVVVVIHGDPTTGTVYDTNGGHSLSQMQGVVESCAQGTLIDVNDIGNTLTGYYGGSYDPIVNGVTRSIIHVYHYKWKIWYWN